MRSRTILILSVLVVLMVLCGISAGRSSPAITVTPSVTPGTVVTSTDGRLQVAQNDSGEYWLQDAQQNIPLYFLWDAPGKAAPIDSFLFSPNNRYLAAIQFTTVILWDAETGKQLTSLVSPVQLSIFSV